MSYEMFTEAGDNLVADLIEMVQKYGLSTDAVCGMMNAKAKNETFGEITDTAVREVVGMKLGCYE